MGSVKLSIEAQIFPHTSLSTTTEPVTQSLSTVENTTSANAQPHASGRWCHLSARTTHANVNITDLLTVSGSVNDVPCSRPMLLDSGASCNFVSRSLARNLQLPESQLVDQLEVRTANGDMMVCGTAVLDASITVPGHKGEHDLVVVPNLDGYDIVLGRSFLKRSRAVVSHDTGTITWPAQSATIVPRPRVSTSNPFAILADHADTMSLPDMSHDAAGSEDGRKLATNQPDTQSTQATRKQPRNKSNKFLRSVNCTATSDSAAQSLPNEVVLKPTPQPITPITPTKPSAHHLAILERVLSRVELHGVRMKPKEGKLPKSRGEFDHKIEKKDQSSPPVKSHAIPLNAEERAQLAIDIKELLEAGLIERSESEWGSPAFYVSKDGGLARRLVIDYRALNRLIKRNTMTLPHVEELMARLGKAKFFTKIDLRSSYHQVLVRPEDRHMTAFVTPIGHFQWNVLPFGEANAPATFVQMMRHLVLEDMTTRGVLDFVDDILIYSATAEDHERDVSDVLDRLEQHELFIKPSKCEWMVQQVDFLGFTVTATDAGTTITPMHSKIDAVTDWPLPRTQTQMRSFMGFANTFRSFIDGFSHISAPLFDLLKRLSNKRTAPLRWNERASCAFDELKAAIANSATLGVADAAKPFIVHTDASDYAVGAVLSQHNDVGELRPIGFVSQKLTDVEYRWSVYEKELFSIVVALKRWSMHLMYTKHPVEIHNDHASLRFLLDQPKLTAKQTRWLALLSTFSDLRFIHVKGKENTRADALSRRSDHDIGVSERQQIRSDIAKQQFKNTFGQLGLSNARLNMLITEVSAGKVEISDAIIAGYERDVRCKPILLDPQRYGYRMRWDLLERIEDGSILVPEDANLRSRILRLVHDAPTSGHLGITKTFDRLLANYHWPNAWIDVAEYVKSCDVCQRMKQRSGSAPGLHHPSEVSPKAHTIAIDFMGPITRTARGKDAILVMMDCFTKRVFLEPVTTTITTEQTAEIIIDRVVRHQGLPRAIRSDRDSRFSSDVWKQIWSRMGTDLNLTTAHHHQSNGMPERFMQPLTAALRSYCNERGTDWDERIAMIEIAYNSAKHSTTGISPFELDLGITARLPLDLCRSEDDQAHMSTTDTIDCINNNEIKAFHAILASQSRDKSRIDAKRLDERYSVGDRAWIDTTDLFIMNLPGMKKLRPRWAGPFEVIRVEGDHNVELKLPDQWRIHPVIHIARLKKANERDTLRFPIDEVINDDDVHWSGIEDEIVVEDLSKYSDKGAAVAQVEHELALPQQSRPRTRAAVQQAHDLGGRYDYVAL